MPLYPYQCEKGHYIEIDKPISECSRVEHCKCRKVLKRLYTVPHIVGTRDNFGIGKSFYSPFAKKEIDNWKDWERAGYKDPLKEDGEHHVKEMVKEKISKINYYHKRGEIADGKTGISGK